ncbi:hypothetical protein RvY_16110 [Ramazzottius varieornatus]|uniref:Uncharacterized protein n=1 Tax=Ramazzottius varieornatus TaxID=947166 RepID=A0A1D1W3V2_RAMVA|nr:hypothetical protein RvY_16110 [Ramazzottius varieornatus]
MSQVPWKNGKELVWDVTVVDTLAQMNVVDSSRRAGSAAEEAEKRKKAKYVDIGQQFSFYPVGLETFGPWGPSATELFETVGKKMLEITGEAHSVHPVTHGCPFRYVRFVVAREQGEEGRQHDLFSGDNHRYHLSVSVVRTNSRFAVTLE